MKTAGSKNQLLQLVLAERESRRRRVSQILMRSDWSRPA